MESGQQAAAAQRPRRSLDDLYKNTPADGVITGLATLFEKGRAIEATAHLEIDAVIEPSETRRHVSRALAAAG